VRRRLTVGLAACAVSLAAACHSSATPTPTYHLVLKSQTAISFLHNQGVARVPGGWILSGTDKPLVATDNLMRTDDNLTVLVRNMGAIPPPLRAKHYDHIGDIDVVGDTIYAPLEQSNYNLGVQVTAFYDVRTLRFRGYVTLHQHQNSFVTLDPATMIAYTQDEFDGNTLLRYDVRHEWKSLAPFVMSQSLHHTQGASVSRGAIWLSTSDLQNHIYRIDLGTGQVDLLGTHGHPGGEGEGIDATQLPSGSLHTLVLDPNQRHIWFENFEVVRR